MFWRRIEQDLADRLRVAIEFATLGAYDLIGDEPESESRQEPQAATPARQPAPPRCTPVAAETRAHIGMSNVPCARVDGQLVTPPCPQVDGPAETAFPRRPSRPDHRLRRGGSIPASQQPCTWAGR